MREDRLNCLLPNASLVLQVLKVIAKTELYIHSIRLAACRQITGSDAQIRRVIKIVIINMVVDIRRIGEDRKIIYELLLERDIEQQHVVVVAVL